MTGKKKWKWGFNKVLQVTTKKLYRFISVQDKLLTKPLVGKQRISLKNDIIDKEQV